MKNSARAIARIAAINTTYRRNKRSQLEQSKSDRVRNFNATYAGFVDGAHRAKLPTGAIVPVSPLSNAGIESGASVLLNFNQSGRAIVRWMPR